jgi:hypothetical protein
MTISQPLSWDCLFKTPHDLQVMKYQEFSRLRRKQTLFINPSPVITPDYRLDRSGEKPQADANRKEPNPTHVTATERQTKFRR